MDYFTRNAGISWMPGLIATLCKYMLIWLILGLVLLPGTVFEAQRKNLSGNSPWLAQEPACRCAHPRGPGSCNRWAGQCLPAVQRGCIPAGEPALRDAARAQAIDMMLNGYVGHKASSGHEFDSRMRAFLGSPIMMMPRMAENAARDTQKGEADAGKARRLFQQWVESRPHRKTLLNGGYKFVSTGVVQRGNKIWAVQIFFAPLPEGMKVLGGSGLY